MNDYEFTIPLDNIAVYVNQTNTFYCQTQIAMMTRAHNAVVLGSPFFTAFVGLFDTENERLGFAKSTRGLPGNSLECIGTSCAPTSAPIAPEPQPQGNGNHNVRTFLLVLGIVLLVSGCICGIVWYRKRSAQDNIDEERDNRRTKNVKRKKGYSISHEKEDDSDEDDNLSIDYQKPMLN